MTHLPSTLVRHTTGERVRQAEQRRLVRSLRTNDTPGRTRRFLDDLLRG